MTATPPKPSLVKSTALSKVQSVTNRINNLLPTVPSALSPVTVYQAGSLGIGSQLSAPTSLFPAGAGYYGTWTAPDLNNGKDYTVQVECFGGGGGGGGGSSTSGGGGGGGAEYAAEQFYPVKPNTTYAWQVGVPGSPGTANSNDNQGATAGGNGGDTVFDIAGLGVAGGVVAHGGQGGDVGNTGLGGAGGGGSFNTAEWGGGAGGTNLPGGGGGSGGQGGTDNPVSLFTAGLLTAPAQAWYIMNDASSSGSLNDATGSNQVAQPGSYGGGGVAFGLSGAPAQVPAYAGGANPPSAPNPTAAQAQMQFVLAQLNQQSGYVLCPGFAFSGPSLTISGWVTPDPSGTWGNTANGSVGMIACNNEIGSPGVALYFRNGGTPSNPAWTLNWYCANSSGSQTASVACAPVPATPVYVVATFSSGAMKLYVNGTLAASATAGFSSVPSWPTVPYGLTLGADPKIFQNWFFGYMSNFWFADGVLSAAGVTQAFSGAGGGGSTSGGAGGGASGGPEANGGAGSAGSGSAGGAGGVPATQPTADIGLNTPASAGLAGAAGGTTNTGLTGAPGAGGGGAGSNATPPAITTIQVPFITAATYCGTDALGSASVAPLTGSLTSPPDFSLVSPLLTFTQAGLYTVYWSVTLSGTITGTEANNFAVFQNEDFAVATSVNAAAAGTYPQAPFTVDVNAGDTLVISNPLTGTSGAVYSGTISAVGGGAAGAVYNPVLQGTSGKLFTGGQASDVASGSKNSLLIVPPNLAAQLAGSTVLRVTLTVTSANPQATQNALMQTSWTGDTFLPSVYGAGNILGSAGVVEVPAGASQVTADLTESGLGAFLLFGVAKALVLGPGDVPGFAAYNAPTAADFYTAIYGPGAADTAGNSLAPYLTITYASVLSNIQQGSPGGSGGILVTFVNQAQTLVGSWNSTSGIQAQGGQLTETSVVLGSSTVTDGRELDALEQPAFTGFTDEQKEAIRSSFSELLGRRLGSGIAGAPGIIAGYTGSTTTVNQSTPGSYTFTVPAGVSSLNVACWGAGAGATGGSSSQGQGGGGGGAYAGEPAYAVSPGDVISYVVGQGGAGTHSGTSGSPDGGATTFDTTHVSGNGVLANGGQHYQGSLNYGPGGATAGNTVAFAGGKGGPLSGSQSSGSGGGGSGGSTGNGGNGNQGGTHGTAGPGGGANGGNGGGSGSNGSSGSAPGGGGGGAGKGSTSLTGGSGGNGKVSISYTANTDLVSSLATTSGTDGAGNAYPTGLMTNAAQVNGDATVTGVHAVGTQITVNGGTGSSQLSVNGSSHFTGNHTVDGSVTTGGNVNAGNQVLVNGASTLAALGVNGSGHLSNDLGVDGDLVVGGSIFGGGLVQGGQSVAGWPLSSPAVTTSGLIMSAGVQNALNSLYNAMVNSGLI